MKAILYVVAGSLLAAFTVRPDEDNIDGIWMGYYRSDAVKEKVVVKFSNADKMELYTGDVDDKTKSDGTYQMLGDSVSLTYTRADGEKFLMQGHLNRRKNFVDGVWKNGTHPAGSFYLERQQIEEKFVNP